MKPSRRSVLQAAAAASTASLFPSFAGRAAAGATRITSTVEIDTDDLVGGSLSWFGPRHTPVATIEVLIDGRWSTAIDIQADHGHGPDDPGGREHGPPVLQPTATRFRVTPLAESSARDLRFHPIAAEPDPLVVASAGLSTISPRAGLTIVERSNWTTRARIPTYDCGLRSSVSGKGCRADVGLRHGIIHHTVNTNDYTEADVPALLRGIQRFHMDTRGWDDIAYNFVIDRFGRIWHAREADIFEPITGGHTTGLNAESVGVAVLGTFTSTDPGQPVVDALATLLGWKCSLHGIDPLGTVNVRSNGGDFADYDDMVDVRTISGHRDNQATSCPGSALYNRLDEIRAGAAELVPVFGHVTPSYFDDRVDIEGWTIQRFNPTVAVDVEIAIDGQPWKTIKADVPLDPIGEAYPQAGRNHGFLASVPITIDSRSITVTAKALDGTTTSLMDLVLFATFIDVQPHLYFAPGIYFLKANALTQGKQPGLYEPLDLMTRAEMATFLWRFMGEPDAEWTGRFVDVEPDLWYTVPIEWLASTGITSGTSPNYFSPGSPVSRAQMAAFLWRLCGRQPSTQQHPFTDVDEAAYYAEPVRWMFELAITLGTTPTTYDPDKTVTRGEIATFLQRLALNPLAWTITDLPPGLQP
ncbi:MAG: S-layer homology domain-containing protein [Actinomycetota bacterium]